MNKHSMPFRRLFIPAATLALASSCAQAATVQPTDKPSTQTPAATGTPAPPPTPTATSTATASPTRTPSPTATFPGGVHPTSTHAINPTPVLSPDFASNILFEHTSEDCQLPCWEGLRVGESNREDVQRVFDEVFGFDGRIDFFNTPPLYSPAFEVAVPDTYTTGYAWLYDLEGSVGFDIHIIVSESKGTLQGIEFIAGPNGPYMPYTSQKIIEKLGTPDYAVAEINLARFTDSSIRFMMFYQDGMQFVHTYLFPPSERDAEAIELCLNSSTHSIYHIVEPFDGFSADRATPLQYEWIFQFIDRFPYLPVEETFGLTEDQLAEIALSDNPCISVPVEE